MNLRGKNIHIIGICGIGMSAIAQYLNHLGATVQGSDRTTSDQMKKTLNNKNIEVLQHSQDNISSNIDFVIKSTAIQNSNVEIKKANELQIPIFNRGDILAEITKQHNCVISITGSHGKTTATTMTGQLFCALEENPTIFSGGIMRFCDSNFHSGWTDIMIVEADESDGTFIQLKSDIAVITNIEFEHAEFYRDLNHMMKAYGEFINNENIKHIVLCGDDHGIKQLKIDNNKKVIKYGFNPDNDIYAKDLYYDGEYIRFTAVINQMEVKDFNLRAHGDHNVLNAICALAVGFIKYGLNDRLVESAKNMMKTFAGVARRFNVFKKSPDITVIDDYAHHPTEIKATIRAARQIDKKGVLIAILQPHRYTRLNSLINDFIESVDEADIAIITDVYSAGEREINSVSGKILCDLILQRVNMNSNINLNKCLFAKDSEDLLQILDSALEVRGRYTVLFMGAGNITEYCRQYIACVGI